MKLYVGNIPRLANEAALAKWFERVGLRVESIRVVQKDEPGAVRRFAWVKIADEVFPPNALRHLKQCTFWGQPLAVRKVSPGMARDSKIWVEASTNPTAA